MNYDGKTYRNLESQVGYLTDVAEALDARITEVAANIPSKMIVEELPEEGDPNITYYVGPKGTDPNLYYEVWVWVQEEPEGPFVWRELEDTDQIDLSGYLEKVETTTTLPQVYAKDTDGSQAMIGVSAATDASSIVRRTSGSQINTALVPEEASHATSKQYVDNNFVAKQTGATTYAQVYVKKADGTQAMVDLTSSDIASGVVQRTNDKQINVPYSPGANSHATSKKYVDDTFLAKQTGGSTYDQVYAKTTGGAQTMLNVSEIQGGSIVKRRSNGSLYAPTPTSNNDCANKAYVDAAVGQLLYLHKLELVFDDVSGTDDLEVLCYLVNGSSTAITSLTADQYCRMTPSHGMLGYDAVSITKLPDSFAYGNIDAPRYNGFMYQYFSGGNLVSGKVDSNTYTMTVTDVVESF